MSDFSRLINNFFIKHLSSQRGVSENTVSNYKYTFIQLLTFLKETKKISSTKVSMKDLDYDTINNFLTWLEEKNNISISTRNNRLAGLKSFFKYVSYHEPIYIEQCSSILAIKSKKNNTKTMNYLTIDATKYLFSTIDKNNVKELRDLCILLLLYESGARVSELINIKSYELKQSPPHTLVLHGKGRKTRIIPIDKDVAQLVSRYRNQYNVKYDDYLFFNSRRGRLTREGVTYILKKHFNKSKSQKPSLFPNKISPHCMRNPNLEEIQTFYIKTTKH